MHRDWEDDRDGGRNSVHDKNKVVGPEELLVEPLKLISHDNDTALDRFHDIIVTVLNGGYSRQK